MNDLGARLKGAREAQGVSLREIATKTKISVGALEALERNDYSRIPGGIFGRAFVRAYALEIGMDADEVVTEFQGHLEESEREAAERGAIRVEISQDDRDFLARQRSAIRVLRAGIGALVLLIGAGVVWYLRAARHPVQVPAPVATTSPVSSAPSTVEESAPAPPAVAPAAPAPLLAAPANPPTPTSAGINIDLQVTSDCWIAIDLDGKRAVSRVFQPGERQQVSARESVALDVGNAGAVVWTINGKPAKPLGRAGAHVQATITPARVAEYLQPQGR